MKWDNFFQEWHLRFCAKYLLSRQTSEAFIPYNIWHIWVGIGWNFRSKVSAKQASTYTFRTSLRFIINVLSPGRFVQTSAFIFWSSAVASSFQEYAYIFKSLSLFLVRDESLNKFVQKRKTYFTFNLRWSASAQVLFRRTLFYLKMFLYETISLIWGLIQAQTYSKL